jgi:membrane-associated protease RseP (regulator of RpoE activity)
VSVLLFLATFLSAWASYCEMLFQNPFTHLAVAREALVYAASLLTVLSAHEMGHFIVGRRNGLKMSAPYFIPLPFGFGTLGAVIRLGSLPSSRTALLRMSAAGPLSGAVAAFVFLGAGLLRSHGTAPVEAGAVLYADPPILKLMSLYLLGTRLDPFTILHPMALAGWVGCLVTFINLLPVGQLDGGHIATALWPRWARRLSVALLALVALSGLYWPGWAVWSLVILILGAWRNVPVPARPRLERTDLLMALGAVVVFGLTFMPSPTYTYTSASRPNPRSLSIAGAGDSGMPLEPGDSATTEAAPAPTGEPRGSGSAGL